MSKVGEATKTTIQIGPGVLGCAFLLLLALKLLGLAQYSWWVVFAPLWGPPAVALGVVTLLLLGAGLLLGVAALKDLWDRKFR